MRPIGARTRVAGVLGWPVTHSRSPALHNAAYRAVGLDAVYVPLPVAPERLAEAVAGVRALGLLGVNVTVPHKQAVARLCDQLEPIAAAIGAVNTVVADGEALVGYNTDAAGFADALAEAEAGGGGADPIGRAVVLGAGGAARALVVALRQRRTPVTVVARDPERARSLVDLGAFEIVPWRAETLAATLEGARLLVDATSAALDDVAEGSVPAVVPIDRLAEGARVASLVYHREPALLRAARARGLQTMDGAGMLIHQAARAFTLMTGLVAPLDAMRAAFAAENTNARQGA